MDALNPFQKLAGDQEFTKMNDLRMLNEANQKND